MLVLISFKIILVLEKVVLHYFVRKQNYL